MTEKTAVGIVLLPPDEIMDAAIELNRKFDPAFKLNKEDRLPHITLFQFVISQKDLGEAQEYLENIASNTKPITLCGVTSNHAGSFMSAKETGDFIFPKAQTLYDLHAEIIHNFQGMASFDVRAEYFYDKDTRERSVDWVRNFLKNASFDNYYPHITLGTRLPVQPSVKIEFVASRLAACQLGDYNTCRKILFETNLNE